ncbi:MAG TPA: Hsp20/alpha crystallin family protein [Gemmataceae bacterium]|nr:Hsp20/alpha crystallin family protein [Gemmataceae bacterium]
MANVSTTPTKDRADLAHTEATRGGLHFSPRVDIVETDKELALFADVPGVRPQDVDLRYENGELHVHGRVQPRAQSKDLLLQEYEEGDFYRAFTIHESIDASRISAECKNGVLIVHLPKVEAVQPRQIAVKGA